MKLLIDEEIVAAEALFSPFGECRYFVGRDIRASDVGDADVLLVRSVTRVNAELLQHSRVRFVGTATAGTDHIDLHYLSTNQIQFVAAPGCNALAVAEHVLCCMVEYARESGKNLADLRVGVVGFGHVGKALANLLRRLEVQFVVNDPPLGEKLTGARTADLSELLQSDVVTLHTPLTEHGSYPSRNLLNRTAIDAMRPGTLLINAARGGIVDEAALVERCRSAMPIFAAIDCWADEPQIRTETLDIAWQASPHIAGHSREARMRASQMLARGLARFVGADDITVDGHIDEPGPQPGSAATSLGRILASVHSLAEHSERMRTLLAIEPDARGAAFDSQRRQFGLRREFASARIASGPLASDTVRQLSALGFVL